MQNKTTNNIKDKISDPRKNEVKTLNNQEFLRIMSKELLKNWKIIEKKGKNMAVFRLQKLCSPVISRNHISKIKK